MTVSEVQCNTGADFCQSLEETHRGRFYIWLLCIYVSGDGRGVCSLGIYTVITNAEIGTRVQSGLFVLQVALSRATRAVTIRTDYSIQKVTGAGRIKTDCIDFDKSVPRGYGNHTDTPRKCRGLLRMFLDLSRSSFVGIRIGTTGETCWGTLF